MCHMFLCVIRIVKKKKKMEILVCESIEPSLSLTRKPNKALYTHTPVNTRLSPREQNRKNEENRPCPRWNIPQESTIASIETSKSYFIYFIIIFYKIANINSFILAFNTIK